MGSSSLLNEIFAGRGLNQFEKIIIECWPTRALAISHEIWLHGWYNVKDNPLFYNRANQRSTGFDVSGRIIPADELARRSESLKGHASSDLVRQVTSARNKLPSNPWRKENRKGLLGNEFNSTSARKCALARVAEDRHNFQHAAENHPQFKGYYHTPCGKFTSAPNASTDKLTSNHIRKYCTSKLVTRKMVVKSNILTDADIGKTFKDIGFWFEAI